jgi:hypothetical protein
LPSPFEEMLQQVRQSRGFPGYEESITLPQLVDLHSEDQITWLLQEWVRGKIQAFDASTTLPILLPRSSYSPKISWDFVSGHVIGAEMGARLLLEKAPARLTYYGWLTIAPTGHWSFQLQAPNLPALRRIIPGRPVILTIPLMLKNEATGEESHFPLLITIEHNRSFGLIVSAECQGRKQHGYSRDIWDLVEATVRAGSLVSSQIFGDEALVWKHSFASFSSSLFTKVSPDSVSNVFETGSRISALSREIQQIFAIRLSAAVWKSSDAFKIINNYDNSPEIIASENTQIVPSPQSEERNLEYPENNNSKNEIKITQSDIYYIMSQKLPDLLARSKLSKICEEMLGTPLIGKSTLEKLDMTGKGPPRILLKGKVHYKKIDFIEWYKIWEKS